MLVIALVGMHITTFDLIEHSYNYIGFCQLCFIAGWHRELRAHVSEYCVKQAHLGGRVWGVPPRKMFKSTCSELASGGL